MQSGGLDSISRIEVNQEDWSQSRGLSSIMRIELNQEDWVQSGGLDSISRIGFNPRQCQYVVSISKTLHCFR